MGLKQRGDYRGRATDSGKRGETKCIPAVARPQARLQMNRAPATVRHRPCRQGCGDAGPRTAPACVPMVTGTLNCGLGQVEYLISIKRLSSDPGPRPRAFGARFLKRVIEEWIKLPITEQWREDSHFVVRVVRGELTVMPSAAGIRDSSAV